MDAAGEYERRRKLWRERLSEYKSLNAELSDLSWTLFELEQQITALHAELVQHPSSAIERRLRDLRRWQGSLEERVLRHMYRTEELSTEIADLRQDLVDAPEVEDG